MAAAAAARCEKGPWELDFFKGVLEDPSLLAPALVAVGLTIGCFECDELSEAVIVSRGAVFFWGVPPVWNYCRWPTPNGPWIPAPEPLSAAFYWLHLFVYQYLEASIEAFLLPLTGPSATSFYRVVFASYLILEAPVLSEYFRIKFEVVPKKALIRWSSPRLSIRFLLARLSFMWSSI